MADLKLHNNSSLESIAKSYGNSSENSDELNLSNHDSHSDIDQTTISTTTTNMADQLRLSPEGKASSDSSSDTIIVGSDSNCNEDKDKSKNDFLSSVDNSSNCYNCGFLPVVVGSGNNSNPTTKLLHLSSQDILNSNNPGIRVVVGAADDEKDQFHQTDSNQASSSQSNSQTPEATWTSKTTTTTVTPLHPLHPLEASVVAATTGHLYSFNKTANNGYSQQSTTQSQHLSPKSPYISGGLAGTEGGPSSHRKASPSRRRYNGPPRSRGNSPCSQKPSLGGTSSQQHHNSSQPPTLVPPPQQQTRAATHLQLPNNGSNSAAGQHVVLLHVNPGETISFQIGEQVQLFQGPATVRMVSSNSTPPVPMPVQVPPGHMVQQIVDENGTLRHIILSPQPTTITMPPMHPHHLPGAAGSNAPPSTYPAGNSTANPGSGAGPPFFGYPPPPPPSFVAPQFASSHLQSAAVAGSSGLSPPPANAVISHNSSTSPSHSGGSSTYSNSGQYHHVHHHHHHHHAVNNCNTNNNHQLKMTDQASGFGNREPPSIGNSNVSRDERTQKQFSRLKKKLDARGNHKDGSGGGVLIFPPGASLNPGGLLNHPIMTATPATAFFLSPANSPKKGINQKKSGYNNGGSTSSSSVGAANANSATVASNFNKTSSAMSQDFVAVDDTSSRDEDSRIIEEVISKIDAPTVNDIGTKECSVKWTPPNLEVPDSSAKNVATSALKESEVGDTNLTNVTSTTNAAVNNNNTSLVERVAEMGIQENDLTYELYVSDRKSNFDLSHKDGSYKMVYTGTLLECKVDDLKPGTEYYFAIRAIVEGISGALSKSTTCRTKFSEPEQPLPPKLASKARTSLSLKWTPPNDNRSKLTNYILESDEGQGGDQFVEVFVGLQKQYKIPKLNPSTCYRFRLAACNVVGKSEYSDIACFCTSGSAPPQPLAPTLKLATVSQLHLEWQKRPSTDEDFTLQMEDETTRHGFLAAYNGRESNYTCLGLKRNLEYKFRLCANNEEGSSIWSKVVVFSTLPASPSAPGKPTVKGKIHAHQFKIEWDKPKDNGGSSITNYTAEIDKGSGFEIVYSGLQTECQCDNLSPGTTYCVRVSATSLGGQSPFSEPTCVTTQPICPGKCPTPRLQGKPKALLLHLKWVSPDFDGGSPITEYEVNLTSPDNTTRQAYIGPDLDCLVAGLLPGRPYLFQVRAANRIGAGLWSESLEAVSGAGPPDAPSSIQTLIKSPHTLQLNWTEPCNNGATITDYRVEWMQRKDNFTQLYFGPNLSYEVKNLTPATTYYFQIQAVNSAGAGNFCSPLECVTLPSSPSVVSSSSMILESSTPSSLSLTWKEPSNHGSPIIHYNVEFAPCSLSIGHQNSGVETVLKMASQTEVVLNHLSPETTYRVRVQAVNSIGPGSFSSSVKVTTKGLPPPAPVLECISASHNSLRLKWGEGRNTDFIHYTLEMENRHGNFVPIYQGPSQSHKVSKLQETSSYCFRISASNDSGDGPYSKEFVFHTTITVPPVLKAPKIVWQSSSSCHLEWSSVKMATDDPISYILQLQKGKESAYNVCYQGTDCNYTVENLVPKSWNAVRLASVRHCSGGETIQGAWCSATSLGYPEGFHPHSDHLSNHHSHHASSSSTSSHSQKSSSSSSHHGGGGGVIGALTSERKPLTDQQWAIIILCAFTLFAVSVAMIIEQLIS